MFSTQANPRGLTPPYVRLCSTTQRCRFQPERQVCEFQSRRITLRIGPRATKGLDFSTEDRLDPTTYNRILWHGLKGGRMYPTDKSLAETRQYYKQALAARQRPVHGDDDDQ